MTNFPEELKNLIIAIIADKGGVGKSTLGCNLLRRIIDIEPLSVLIDCDSDQHSSAKLALDRKMNSVEPALNIVNVKLDDLETTILELSKKFKIILIEFGKAIGDMDEEERTKAIKLAAKLADKIVMPIQPTSFDTKTIEVVEKKLIALNLANIPALIIPNRVMSARQLSALTSSAPSLKYFKISKSYMENRICYQEVHDTGKTIFDIKPKTKSERNAVSESEQIFQEIIYDN